MKRTVLSLSFGVLLSCTLAAQTLTLEDIFVDGKFRGRSFAEPLWMEDGVSWCTMAPEGLVRIDARTFDTTVIVPARSFIPEGGGESVRPEDFEFSRDGSKLVVYANSARVWRRNTRGDYWLIDIASGNMKQLGRGLEPSRMMFGKLSAAGDKFAYVYKNDIFVEDVATGEHRRLTFDGGSSIINGTFDWVYEEEFDDRDGFRWSPDGSRIIYWHSDTEGTGVFNMINNIDSVYSEVIPLPYPKVGTTNSAVKIGVVTVDDARTQWFDIPGDARNNYLAGMEFIPGTNRVCIQQFNRLQNTVILWSGNVNTMDVREFYRDADEAYLEFNGNVVWLGGNESFLWISEKDGWRALYRVSGDGKEEKMIAGADFDVIDLYGPDAAQKYVYYSASPDNAVERYLYRSRLDGKGSAERMTPQGFAGCHSYCVSPGAKFALHTFGNSGTPNTYELVSLPNHRSVRVMEDNSSLKKVYGSYGFNGREYFKVDIGEAVLDGWMIKPKDFDPSRKYPVIFHIYGEPASSTVTDSWSSGILWNQMLASEGYVVMSVDPRGTNNPKGREWRKCVYGRVGVLPPDDHAAAVKVIEKMFPFVDVSRIGVWGWSGGGTSTAHLMFRYPEIYSVGIAVAGVYSRYLYDTIYEERYMGLPSTNHQGFHDGSAINFASGLKGDLLLIHGTGDDNVHYQSCEMLVNELVRQDKVFWMMSYPMRSHGIFERENTSCHLYRTMLRFWQDHLQPNK